MNTEKAERYRTKDPLGRPQSKGDLEGFFMVPINGRPFAVIASVGMGWEHVSVSHKNRTPTWEEMCYIKDLFWTDDDCVIQYHPPKKDYVNNCGNCLHLWRPTWQAIPRPPRILVGI